MKTAKQKRGRGVMAPGFKYGRTKPGTSIGPAFSVSSDLHDYIKEKYGSTCCRVLTSDFDEFKSRERFQHCVTMIEDLPPG
ncbi:C-GCAxxG-C-C family protein [Halanaerobaculum tunisiense]